MFQSLTQIYSTRVSWESTVNYCILSSGNTTLVSFFLVFLQTRVSVPFTEIPLISAVIHILMNLFLPSILNWIWIRTYMSQTVYMEVELWFLTCSFYSPLLLKVAQHSKAALHRLTKAGEKRPKIRMPEFFTKALAIASL